MVSCGSILIVLAAIRATRARTAITANTARKKAGLAACVSDECCPRSYRARFVSAISVAAYARPAAFKGWRLTVVQVC